MIILFLFTAGFSARAQLYSNDFENQYTWYPPWFNINIAADSTALEGEYVCVCDSTQEFGLGIAIEAGTLYPRQNINLQFEFLFKTESDTPHAEIVFCINDANGFRYWQSYPLAAFLNDTATWSKCSFNLDFPSDYIGDKGIKTYIWNRGNEKLWFDNAKATATPWTMSFLPVESGEWKVESGKWGLLTEYILDGDSITDFQYFTKTENGAWKVENDLLTTTLTIDTFPLSTFHFPLSTSFHKDAQLLRQAFVVPFSDSTLTVYRRNMKVENGKWETGNFGLSQKEYYLDREGFKIGEGDHTVISYHQTGISSTQFDAANRTAYFNLDYWRDHPMIHYPLNDTLENYFEDISCQRVYNGMEWNHSIVLYAGNDVSNLPRIMKIPFGYESGIIFTEHADWTDIRTHRAVLFGNEHITQAKDATGGFVYYGIPVTKSVFYNNPDQVTNAEISRGAFPGLHTTIKTDRDFEKLLKQLHKIGFDICLHTPEQYTTTSDNLKEALKYMRRKFKSTTWIDHGYNNGSTHNREDMVCDGLNQQSDVYAADLWQSHGIKYLWNAYYEENRMEQWYFDNNLMKPYPGFGDALPNRQITTFHFPLFTWCTPSTLEATSDNDWNFYYNEERLQRIVDNHDVHITHIYPAWVIPGRTFWTYDADSTIIALPGMNQAFERIAKLRDEHKMLPMTIKTYLDYYSGLLNVSYEIIDAEHIRLKNQGDEIKGFTLLCPSPIRLEDNRYYEFRKSNDDYYVWFDLKANDEVTIKINN